MKAPEPATVVVMGGTGDLMRRKLLPALYANVAAGALDPNCRVLAVARGRGVADEGFRAWAAAALAEAGLPPGPGPDAWTRERLHYQTIGAGGADDYAALARRIAALEALTPGPGDRVFYLALPPQALPAAVRGLGGAGLSRGPGWTRLVVEKPFGRDLASARALNALVHEYFEEPQVYRIDHYLGKETVQNLLVLRFANPIFETLWNRDRVASVQITVAEDVGVEDRADYYEDAGAVRDIVQNHVIQLLALVAMEVPGAFEADQIHNEKVKVLRAIRPLSAADVVYGQYAAGRIGDRDVAGYRDEPGVAPASRTETFAALRLGVQNWRWHGVPFYLRAGKRMAQRLTQIVVTFRRPPVMLFPSLHASGKIQPNALVITIQPDEGFDLAFEVKAPGAGVALQSQRLRFRYAEAFAPLPDAYETLLVDVVAGDQTLFVRADEVEAAWALLAPLLAAPPAVHVYPAGSWGPPEAARLLDSEAAWAPA
ncbi:MAG: glucose-6-phosphate dehydrogenase [Armatimonadota bacterium]|nr:glucose-6-phosphate dehydrogenase [Armatimonadota bacterium]MDR7454087.1 glucose-6-phosphate dehydrogenase [Armatimonadota bacterium]MDR7496419.1 glucose-6-phosphate dehydrogenase [Armatimonadota bacterium]MDR7511458.1 glucose-6-phosphate dehydrogenase [Armatimonadota bacterium]